MSFYIAYGSNLNLEQMALRCPGRSQRERGRCRDIGWLSGERQGDITLPCCQSRRAQCP